MRLISGPFNVTVFGNQQAWVPGPIFQPGDYVRVQASGVINWGTVGGSGGTTLTSSPATFSTPNGAGSASVAFNIPAGSYSAATWNIQGTHTLGIQIQLTIGTDTDVVGTSGGNTPFNFTTPVSTQQLADINTAGFGPVGATITVTVFSNGNSANITAFSLMLVGAGGTIEYALPEGGYPPSYPASPGIYDPTQVLQNASWTGGALAAPSAVPISLVAVVLPDGFNPSIPCYYTILQPNEDTTFTAAQLASAGATISGANYRIWFLFNDAVGGFSANTGSFAVIINRYALGITMAEPLVSLLRPQFGVEASYGTQATATRVPVFAENGGYEVMPEQVKEGVGVAGIAFEVDESVTTEMAKGSVKAQWEYRDNGYILSSVYGASTDTVLSSSLGVVAYSHTWEDQAWLPITPQSYTVEGVKDAAQRAYNATGLVYTGFKLDTARSKQSTLTANLIAKLMGDGITPSVGQNNIQTINVNGAPTGGSCILQIDQQSVTFSPTTTPAALQTLIRALATANGATWSAATVAGTTGVQYVVTNPSGVFIPTFVPVYTVGGVNTLTGGTSPTVTVVNTQQGGMNLHGFVRVLPNLATIEYAADYPTLINNPTVMLDEFETAIDIGDRFDPVWRQNTVDVGYGYLAQKEAKSLTDSITLTMAYNTAVATWITNSRTNVRMYVRVMFTGVAIGSTGQNFSIAYDCTGFPKWNTLKDSEGNIHTAELTFTIKHDIVAGFRARWTLINDVPNYLS